MSAARDGGDVTILLPATSDVRWVAALSRAGYRPLLEAGLWIFEYGGPMMHAKTHVVTGLPGHVRRRTLYHNRPELPAQKLQRSTHSEALLQVGRVLPPNARCAPVSPCTRRNRARS